MLVLEGNGVLNVKNTQQTQEGDELQSEVGDPEGRWNPEEEEHEKSQIAATSAASYFLFLFHGVISFRPMTLKYHPHLSKGSPT